MRRSLLITLFSVIFTSFSFPTFAQKGRVWREIGKTLEQSSEELIRVIDQYTQALYRDPRNGYHYLNRANAYFDRGDYRKAILDYSQALTYFPNVDRNRLAQIYLQRGLCRYILGEYPSSIADFTHAIEARPNKPDAYYFRGKIYQLAMNQPQQARRDFLQVLKYESYPSIQSSYTRLMMGDFQSAHAEIQALERNKSHYPAASRAILDYNIAGYYALQGQADPAVRYLEQAFRQGYSEYQWVIRDINFRPIANEYAFESLMRRNGLRYQHSAMVADNRGYEPNTRGNIPTGDRPSQPAGLLSQGIRFEDANGNQRLDASEQCYLVFSLENVGPGTASGLVVNLKEQSGLSGLNFLAQQSIGDLVAGQKREIRLAIQGDAYLQTGVADFRIEISERFGFDAAPLQVSVATGAFAPPDVIVADHVFASAQGGTFRLGTLITLKTAIQNRGSGVARDVKATFTLPEDVFSAGETSFILGDMAPGADQQIDFEFFTNNRFQNAEVAIQLTITEVSGQYNYQETLKVGINEQLEVNDRVVITPSPNQTQNPRDIQLTSDVDRNLPKARRANPDAIAVIIGNRDYQNPDVPPVDFALQDAASMRKYLVESFGFDDNNIIFLSNATQADFNGLFGTKEDHRARLYNLVKPNQSDVFIFYSGHGAPDLTTEDAYFVPVDCDPSLVKFNGYAINTLYANLAKIQYRSLSVVIDACFSGASDKGTLTPQASIVRIRSNNSVLKDPKAMIFTAATGAQIASWYPDQSHGLFTYYFLKGLQGAADADNSGELTLGEMREYLGQEVPYMARRLRNRTQTPEVYGLADKSILTY